MFDLPRVEGHDDPRAAGIVRPVPVILSTGPIGDGGSSREDRADIGILAISFAQKARLPLLEAIGI